jgi:hypothetical protein
VVVKDGAGVAVTGHGMTLLGSLPLLRAGPLELFFRTAG